MNRNHRAAFRSLAASLLAAAIAVAGCGGSTATPARTTSPSLAASAAASAGISAGASALPSASVAASPTTGIDMGLPHVEAALEDLLPDTIGAIALQKLSEPLSTLVASSQGGEKLIYAPWLVQFGKTPDEVNVAIAVDFTNRINFHANAIRVPGATAETLSATFAETATKAGWPVKKVNFALKSVLEITDPTAAAKGLLGVGYVYASGDVLYIVVTDDSALLLECMIKLP
jgi:hypothetical protein